MNFKNVFFKRGHTRLPEYAMGKKGRIILYHRAHVYPDSNAHFKGEAPEYLYTVEFFLGGVVGQKVIQIEKMQ